MTNRALGRLAGLLLFASNGGTVGCGSGEVGNLYFPAEAETAASGQSNIAGTTASAATSSSVNGTSASSGGTSGPTAPTADGQGLPCNVKQILTENCVSCHGVAPQFGAPMPLVSNTNFTAPAVTDPMRSVGELVLERVSDSARPMPPAPYDRLEADEVSVLSSWINGGAQPSDEVCETPPAGEPTEGTDFLAGLPGPERCDVSVDLLAADGSEPFRVPQEDDHYECFYFKAPSNKVELTGMAPIIDDSRVLHHWLLYVTSNAELVDGTREACTGIHPNDTLLGGWAPGGDTYALPEGVGLQMPQGDDVYFILEIHYNNVARHADAVDRSGVRVCMTENLHPNVAAVHWLGTENIFLLPGQAQGGSTCNPNSTEPIHILSVTPHMHELGTHSTMVINRADGSEEILLDKPFDFNTQVGYETPATLMPGDSISSTCVWNNTSGALTTFGEGTSDEMCYLFTIAYPAGALNTGGDLLGLGILPGQNKCMK